MTDVDLTEAQAVLACLAGLRGRDRRRQLMRWPILCTAATLPERSEVLNRWAATR